MRLFDRVLARRPDQLEAALARRLCCRCQTLLAEPLPSTALIEAWGIFCASCVRD